MSLSRSTIENGEARRLVQELQRRMRIALSLPPEPHHEPRDTEENREYLSTNPDYSASEREDWAKRLTEPLKRGRPDVIDPSGTLLLAMRVDELWRSVDTTEPRPRVGGVCFGLMPGGGLDACTIKVANVDQHAILIPDGLFNLCNLFVKSVVLLQPWEQTSQGLVYFPSASFQQLDLASHPYIEFRIKDLLYAFFVHGEPAAALPYLTAVPYQDRLSYLLTGTELFVLAHEIAHVTLGHLRDGAPPLTPEAELEADDMAFNIVRCHFSASADYATARATLCGFLFLSMNRLWQLVLQRGSQKTSDPLSFGHHPGYEERFERFASRLSDQPGETPSWYIHVHNAIRFATEHIPERLIDGLYQRAGGLEGLSARVLPESHLHLGHRRGVDVTTWWRTIADALIEGGPPRLTLLC